MKRHVYKSGVREACQRLSILEPILGVMFAPRLRAQTLPSDPNGSHAWPVPTLSAPPATGEFASAGGETARGSAGVFCGQLTTRGRGVRTTRPKRSELSPLGSAGAGPTWWARGCVYRHLPLFIALGGGGRRALIFLLLSGSLSV